MTIRFFSAKIECVPWSVGALDFFGRECLSMREVKTEKPKKSFLLKAGLLCLVAYFSYVLITQQIAIGEKRRQLDALNDQIKVQEMRNSELEHIVSNNQSGNDTYREAEARSELDYAKSGERVFVNIAGD